MLNQVLVKALHHWETAVSLNSITKTKQLINLKNQYEDNDW